MGLSHTSGFVASRQMGASVSRDVGGPVENEAIEEILVHGIGHLDDDGAHRPGKRRMADKCNTKFVVEVPVVILAEADDVGRFPRAKNSVDNARVSLLDLADG